ncbi:hypothetical protein OG302_43085 [Streptomyces sp. NBC_01283]|uniref:hypothetical protein n=1 Tax=Streptomyces sp. NBC_01283 TaxID=2903812 RepID=UPI00352E224C|nr:hypothetical protein OG302_43085 [Streptomyces sp. NBC_01283]
MLTRRGITKTAISGVTTIGEGAFTARAALTAAAATTGAASTAPVAAVAVSSVSSVSFVVTAVAAPAAFTAATSNKLGRPGVVTVENRHPMPFVGSIWNAYKEGDNFPGGNAVVPLAEIGTNTAGAAGAATAGVVAAREAASSARAPKFHSQTGHSRWDYPLMLARFGPRL